jgi:hypothetical protein
VIRFTATETGITQERLACQRRRPAGTRRRGLYRARSALLHWSPQGRPQSGRKFAHSGAGGVLPDLPRTDGDHAAPVADRPMAACRVCRIEALECRPARLRPAAGPPADVARACVTGAATSPARGRFRPHRSRNRRYSATLQRRYSILAEELPNSAAEAHVVEQTLPARPPIDRSSGHQRPSGPALGTQPPHLFRRSSGANPELPYVMFIPLAETPNGHRKDSYLEVADVRQADLSNLPAGGALELRQRCLVPGYPDHGAESCRPSYSDAGARAGSVSTAWG